MNRKTGRLYNGFESKFPKYRDTEVRVYLARNASQEIGKGAVSMISQMVSGISRELVKSRQ